MAEAPPPLSRTLLSHTFQEAVRNARVTSSTFVYGYGSSEQVGLSGPNTTLFASMDNETLERWIQLLFGKVRIGPRLPAAIDQWNCLAPCILRVLLWFVRVEAVTRCSADISTNPRLMTTKCPSAADSSRAAAITADIENGVPPRYPTARIRTVVNTPSPCGHVHEVAYFKGPILRLLQDELIRPRAQYHETLCLPALAFAPLKPETFSSIQTHQGWHLLCCPQLWGTSHNSGRLYSAINDPAVYDETGNVVDDEDAVDKHTLEVWAKVAEKIVKECPQMEVVLRRAVGKLVAAEEQLIQDGRKALVAFLSEHPAYDFLFWSPDTVAHRTCYGDELVDAVVSFLDTDE